ncbi:MAG: chemotaxis protein CheW [Methylophagaceae bacterium]
MADSTSNFIPCMLIPLQQHYLLLPNTTIAEVIPMPHVEIDDSKSHYWVGQYNWNSQQLAVIDLESLVEGNPSNSSEANKLCILYGINSEANLNAYALPCYGAPQLIHLNESALKLASNTQDSEFLHCQIQIGNKVAYLPNLDTIEMIIDQQP